MKTLHIVGDDFKHCQYSNNPLPPTSFYPDINWKWQSPPGVSNTVFYTNSAVHQGISSTYPNKICWLIEPYDLISSEYELVKQNNHKFKYVFTHERTLLELGENYRFIPFGGCWIDEQDRQIHEKSKLVSIVASQKTQLQGHKLRHSTINQYGNLMDVYGNGYLAVDKKITAYKDYQFSVVIENCKRDYWFTEKLIDSLITGTIPIYWGCPSIGDFFDIRGFIIVDSVTEIGDALKKIHSDSTIYSSMKQYIETNYELSKRYVLAERFIDEQYLKKGMI